ILVECQRKPGIDLPGVVEHTTKSRQDAPDRGGMPSSLRLADHQEGVDQLPALTGLKNTQVHETFVLDSRPAPRRGRVDEDTPYPRAAPWSASTWATHAVTFTPVGRSMNSFGPWAFEPGPMTPVTRNCACGNRSPSMLMNGMEPPSPSNIAGAWKYAREARPTDSRSHSAIVGAFQPVPGRSPVENVTRPPYGGSASSTSFTRCAARAASAVGGRRRQSLPVVCARSP